MAHEGTHMKKTLLAIVALMAASSAMAVTANNPFTRDIPEPPPVLPSPYTFELGLTTHHETYREYGDDGRHLMQEEAWFTGVKGGVTRTIGDTGGSVVLTGEYALGKSNYTGSYLGGSYGDVSVHNLDRSLLELTAMYKQTAPLWNGLSAGLGIGYRRLVDGLDDVDGGYKRTNDRLYLTVALEQSFKLKNWTITPGVEYDRILVGKAKSDVFGGVSVNQNNGYGAKGSIVITHKDRFNTTVEPYFRYWDVKASNVDAATGLYEPRNKTTEIGVNVTFKF
jgi:hypothetical protein